MGIRAWHIWLCSLPPLGLALALPVTRSAWLEGEFDVSGLAAVFWIVLDAIFRVARLVTVPSVTAVAGAWFSVAWVLVFASILLSPVTVFSRAPAASGRWNAWLLLQILLFATTYGLTLLESQDVHESFQFAGYRWLGVALLVLSLAFCMRIVEIRPPAGDFTVEQCCEAAGAESMRNIIDRFPWWLALAGTLPVLLAGVLEVERLQPVQENADHISQQAGTAETARRVNAQRLVRWEEEQLRRRRAAEVRTRREREGSRIETQMANRIDQMNASNPFFCREMVLHTEHVMSIYPDHSIRCVQHEWWEPKKERPDPRTFPAVLPAYSPWPPWYGQP